MRRGGERRCPVPMPTEAPFQSAAVPGSEVQVVPVEVKKTCADREVRHAAWYSWRLWWRKLVREDGW